MRRRSSPRPAGPRPPAPRRSERRQRQPSKPSGWHAPRGSTLNVRRSAQQTALVGGAARGRHRPRQNRPRHPGGWRERRARWCRRATHAVARPWRRRRISGRLCTCPPTRSGTRSSMTVGWPCRPRWSMSPASRRPPTHPLPHPRRAIPAPRTAGPSGRLLAVGGTRGPPADAGRLATAPLAQRQSNGLLIRRFWVRIPGGAPRPPAAGDPAARRPCRRAGRRSDEWAGLDPGLMGAGSVVKGGRLVQ